MKSKKRKSLRWGAMVLFLSSLFLVCFNGCRKGDVHDKVDNSSVKKSLDIEANYKKQEIDVKTRDTLNASITIRYVPQWESMKYSKPNDSTEYALIQLIPMGKADGKESIVRMVDNTPFLVVANGTKFYFARFFPDRKNGKSDEGNFLKNGELSMVDILTNNLFTYNYTNGKSVYNTPSQTKTAKNSSKKAGYEVRCREEGTCLYSQYCLGVIYTAMSPQGTCDYPTQYTDCDYSANWQYSKTFYNTVCENVWVPDGPGDGGGTGGGWTSTPIQTSTNTDKAPASYNWRIKLDEDFSKYLKLTTPLVKTTDLGGGIAVEQSNPDAFNCHYYTFSKTDKSAIRETLADQGNPLWVVGVDVKEANFFQVTSNVKVGDIVLYQVPTPDGGAGLSHSGIVSGVDAQGFATEITSKMGEYEIIQHHPRDVPSDYGSTDPTFQSGGQTYLSRIYYRRR